MKENFKAAFGSMMGMYFGLLLAGTIHNIITSKTKDDEKKSDFEETEK